MKKSNMQKINSPSDKEQINIIKWKVKQGAYVNIGQILCLYSTDKNMSVSNVTKLKSTKAGCVRKFFVKEGETVAPGEQLLEFEACAHTTIMKDLCAECGADLHQIDSDTPQANVPMVHSIPELKVTPELAKKLGKEDCERLLCDKKLVLLVDLDQTLVHTTNENIPPNIKDVKHFQLKGPWGSKWYHTRLRPGTEKFLKEVEKMYELHVCTFGARMYAHAVAAVLDPTGRFFSHRILSRDECFDPTTKAANLKALFPCGDNMVCIIDDREDVWRNAPNLIHVKPYEFFQNTGDINAPLGVPKRDNINAEEESDLKEKSPQIAEKVERGNSLDVIDDICPLTDENNLNQISDPACEKVENHSFNKPENGVSSGTVEIGKCYINTECRDKCNKEDTNKNNKNTVDSNEVTTNPNMTENHNLEEIVKEDPDDYLLYLEDILKKIYLTFYKMYTQSNDKIIPDLKEIIPKVKRQVLANCHLVFSGLVPTHQNLRNSQAYLVAKSLGAEVDDDFSESTTHLVAMQAGTQKVRNARRMGSSISVVSPLWLWACSERWDRVDERLFPLQKGSQNNSRKPPPHCTSLARTESNFKNTLNPLFTFSSDEIADMDREVQDVFEESDESSSNSTIIPKKSKTNNMVADLGLDDSSMSSSSSASIKHFEPSQAKKRRRSIDNPPDDDSWSRMGEDLERQLLN